LIIVYHQGSSVSALHSIINSQKWGQWA